MQYTQVFHDACHIAGHGRLPDELFRAPGRSRLSGRLLVTLVSLPGTEHLAFTSDGRFHGSPGGLKLVAFRVGGALADAKRFEAKHHRPELVARALTAD